MRPSEQLRNWLAERDMELRDVHISRDLMRPGRPRTDEELDCLVEFACLELLEKFKADEPDGS